ncbi:MAG: hypothetical protein WCV82_00615 [Candidatus Paceibacterota bacterium]
MDNETLKEINKKLDKILFILGGQVKEPMRSRSPSSVKSLQKGTTFDAHTINFNQNNRAFFKKYIGDMTGPEKYTLTLAFCAKGKIGLPVESEKINNLWNKLFVIFGGKLTSRTYATRAKEKGWIDSNKHGEYFLRDQWAAIF